MKENNSNMVIMTVEEIIEKYGDGIFDKEPLWWNSDQLRDILFIMLCEDYLALSDEELFDITPFDVLNDINKLI